MPRTESEGANQEWNKRDFICCRELLGEGTTEDRGKAWKEMLSLTKISGSPYGLQKYEVTEWTKELKQVKTHRSDSSLDFCKMVL